MRRRQAIVSVVGRDLSPHVVGDLHAPPEFEVEFQIAPRDAGGTQVELPRVADHGLQFLEPVPLDPDAEGLARLKAALVGELGRSSVRAPADL